MNIAKFSLSLLVFCLCLSMGYSQSNFIPGYILLSPEDTVFGELNNMSYAKNAQFIEFRLSKDDEKKRFSPSDLFAYRFDGGKYYISKDVKIGNIRQRVFMEYLINGVLDVYLFQDKKKENRFFVSNDTLPLREILYSSGIKMEEGGKRGFFQEKRYEGLLRYYTQDSPEMQSQISNIDEPDRKKLIAFAKKYHEATCEDGDCIIYEKKAPRKVFLKISGALLHSFSEKSEELTVEEASFWSFYDLGIDALFQVTDNSERIFVGIGLHKGYYMDDSSSATEGISIPISMNYLIPKDGFSPIASYSFYVLNGLVQKLDGGIKYRKKNVSLCLSAGVYSFMFIDPIAWQGQFSLIFDL